MTIYHRKLLPFWISFALLSQQAGAIGMGEVQLHSHLGEPLQAEVLLNKQGVMNEGSLVVTLGSSADYQMLGMEFSYLHTQLIIEPFTRNGQDYLRIRSREPVTEPYLDFVLNMRSPQGQVMREFTLLLDPPNAMLEHNQQFVHNTSQHPTELAAVSAAKPQFKSKPKSIPANPDLKAHSDAAYLVKKGDSLWKIADKLRAPSVSHEQTMAALVALNPHAFINGDPNRLVASARLAIPASHALAEVPAAAETTPTAAAPEQAAATSVSAVSPKVDLPAENALLRAQLSELNSTVSGLEQRLANSAQALQELNQQLAKLQEVNSLQVAAQQLAHTAQEVDSLQVAAQQLGNTAQETNGLQVAVQQPVNTALEVLSAGVDSLSLPAAQASVFSAAVAETEMRPVAVAEGSWWGAVVYWLGIAGVAGWVARNLFRGSRRQTAFNHEPPANNAGESVAMPFEQARMAARMREKQPLRRAEPVVAMTHELANFNLPVSPEPEQAPDLPRKVDDPVDAAVTAGLFVAFGRYDEAEELLNYALNKNPEQVELKLLLLNVYLQTHRHRNYRLLEQEILLSDMSKEERTKLAALQESYKIHHGGV